MACSLARLRTKLCSSRSKQRRICIHESLRGIGGCPSGRGSQSNCKRLRFLPVTLKQVSQPTFDRLVQLESRATVRLVGQTDRIVKQVKFVPGRVESAYAELAVWKQLSSSPKVSNGPNQCKAVPYRSIAEVVCKGHVARATSNGRRRALMQYGRLITVRLCQSYVQLFGITPQLHESVLEILIKRTPFDCRPLASRRCRKRSPVCNLSRRIHAQELKGSVAIDRSSLILNLM